MLVNQDPMTRDTDRYNGPMPMNDLKYNQSWSALQDWSMDKSDTLRGARKSRKDENNICLRMSACGRQGIGKKLKDVDALLIRLEEYWINSKIIFSSL